MCCSTNETFIDLSSDKLFKEQSREKAKELYSNLSSLNYVLWFVFN